MKAKRAQEMSSELYLSYLLGLQGPVDTTAIAMDVKDRSIDVIVCSMGIDLRIYVNEVKDKLSLHHTKDDDIQTLRILWEESHTTQVSRPLIRYSNFQLYAIYVSYAFSLLLGDQCL